MHPELHPGARARAHAPHCCWPQQCLNAELPAATQRTSPMHSERRFHAQCRRDASKSIRVVAPCRGCYVESICGNSNSRIKPLLAMHTVPVDGQMHMTANYSDFTSCRQACVQVIKSCRLAQVMSPWTPRHVVTVVEHASHCRLAHQSCREQYEQ